MRNIAAFCITVMMIASPAVAQSAGQISLFDHLAGHWVLRGTIDGAQTTHDVDAEPVLNRGYIRLHEVSREKDAKGAPAYEAIIFISVDTTTGEYNCLWLDNTSNAGLSTSNGIAHATPSGDSIPFLFKAANGNVFHNTFIYSPTTDSWQWVMDDESKGKMIPFARLTLKKG